MFIPWHEKGGVLSTCCISKNHEKIYTCSKLKKKILEIYHGIAFILQKEFLLLHNQSYSVINCKYAYVTLPRTEVLEIVFVISTTNCYLSKQKKVIIC